MENYIKKLSSQITEERYKKFLKILNERTDYITLIVEDIGQPHNASAIIRTCEGLGIQNVYIIEKTKNFKTNSEIALGASKWIKINKYDSSIKCIQELKNKGYKVIGTKPNVDKSIFDMDITKPMAFVFGNEVEGVSKEIDDNVDEICKIPMYGFTESFNISVSAGMILSYMINKIKNSNLNLNWRLDPSKKQEILIDWLESGITNLKEFKNKFYPR